MLKHRVVSVSFGFYLKVRSRVIWRNGAWPLTGMSSENVQSQRASDVSQVLRNGLLMARGDPKAETLRPSTESQK